MKNSKKFVFLLTISMLLLLVAISPAKAIKFGELDVDDHPYVGLVVVFDADGEPLWRGSGTLISPQVFLTAGHVTEAPAVTAVVWFDADVDAIPEYPFGGGNSVEGVCYTHPLYYLGPWYLNDIGIVVLDEPVDMDVYAELPAVGVIDGIKSNEKQDAFTAVGYGLQYIINHPFKAPRHIESERVRYQTTLTLVNRIGSAGVPAGNVVVVSGNTHTGGTCFGDSGGPLFLSDSNTIVGVTSFGMNANCAGIGGANRIDTVDDLAWISSFL